MNTYIIIKFVEDIYLEDYKPLMKEIKDINSTEIFLIQEVSIIVQKDS